MPSLPQRPLSAIADELERRALEFESARDPRCVFCSAYARLTRVLEAELPGAGFSDPGWIVTLANVFSEYYLRALHDHDQGTLARGAWSTVFAASTHGRTSVLEELVLGMTAHIVNDLPLALCEVGLTAPDGGTRITDYHRLNEVLGAAIPAIQDEVSRRYEPLLHVLDQLFESYDEILTNYGLRISRAIAWYNALRLLDPESREAARAAIARSPEVTLQQILEPPWLSLRIAFRGARVLARFTRRWPSAPRAVPLRKTAHHAPDLPVASHAT